ncbi:NADH-ubiquinone oxidoreductase (plasmid) [Halostagnicola larsenii XH-48]|uniref:NADH-ubiquinone oxidoreductase n=1 Tax=Halostagnicola larsenii XH-48 TaxID=797299 RepID=W0JUZ6_9EURY|nr:proton-conducting transporter membrane subunit [Halostagnicola larsenii]AHG02396.1 NADH-ubiquinone oxidoreductase [Halostagnicola larsenii XH-48]
MVETIVIAPMLVALVSIAVTLATGQWPRFQRIASVGGVLAYVVVVAALDWLVVLGPDAPGAAAYQVGGWGAPFGITLVADGLAAFMLAIVAVVALYSIVFSVFYVDPLNQRVYYHPLVHVLLLGVTGAFLTGDLFNLFVWFEVMLMASYAFVAFYGDAEHTAAGMRYVVMNLIGSVLMLLGIGGLYATLGTLNMADMAQTVADPAADVDAAPVVGLSMFVFAPFALKAGLVPFQFWVPSAYRAAPAPIAAMLAGATKKVGIYAIVRLYFTVFAGATVPIAVPGVADASLLTYFGPILLVLGSLSIIVGGLGAIGRETIDGLLAYSSIGQVGFIAVPIGIAGMATSASLQRLGILAGLIYALHHALTKSMLFLSAGAIQNGTGTTRLAELGGLAAHSPVLGGSVFVGSLSLVGIPPLSGFFGKFFAFEAAVSRLAADPTAGAAVVLLVLLAGAVLTIVYATRIWVGSFWGTQTAAVEGAILDTPQVLLVASLAVLVILVGVGFDPVYRFADAAATAALDTEAYVDVVGLEGGENG